MERFNKLKRLFEANILTEEDRAFIRDLCKEFHLAFEPRNTRCQNCYKDQIIIIMAEIKKKNATKKGCKWSMIEPHGSDEQMNSDFYRWMYTALTRASENVFLVNFPTENNS